jgi:hypothetical protein
MIITKIKAGLGNQMFQYAAGYGLAKDQGLPLGIDLSWFNLEKLSKGIAKREFGLPVAFKHVGPGDLPVVTEKKGFSFQRFPEGPCYLSGHWETEKFFKAHSEAIRDLFGPPEGVSLPSFDLSIHIRGTDFLKLSCRKGLGTEDYYRETFAKAKEELGHKCSVAVFTDDPEYARKVLGKVDIRESNRDIEDIWGMSLCRNNIIANSSFSWWGAWLNKHEDKKVYYPERLYQGFPPVSKTDWAPEDWK